MDAISILKEWAGRDPADDSKASDNAPIVLSESQERAIARWVEQCSPEVATAILPTVRPPA